MEEWTIYRLGDVINVLDYMRVPLSSKQREFRKGNYPYYGAQGIIDYVDSFLFDGEYLLIAEDGENLKSKKQNIAQIARGRYWVNNHAHIVESNGRCDIRYICYLLNQIDLSGYITGSAQPKLNQANLLAIELRLPCLEVQKRVSDFLETFDDKIELNNRINHNLEQQAQAIYKSWFVDFEPFRGGNFVDSELGMIPEGWNCGLVSDLLSIKYGKDHKKLSDGDIPVYGSGGVMRYVDTKIYEGEAVLIPRKGTLNNVFYVNKAFWTVDTMFYATSKEANSCIFSYLFLKNKDLASMNAGSAVPSMTTDILNNMQIVIPPEEVLESFNNLSFVLFMQMKQYTIENIHLCNQRDTLLPKLMSGELKINDLTC